MNRSHRASIKRLALNRLSASDIPALRGKSPARHMRGKMVRSGATSQAADLVAEGGPVSEKPGTCWIFVDPSAENAEVWLKNLQGEIVLLDSSRQGLEQVAGWLHGQIGVTSLHILAHGAACRFTLGNSLLDAQSLSDQHADALAVIAGVLAPQASLHLHGPDLDADGEGKALIHALASITGAQVEASAPVRAPAQDLPEVEMSYVTRGFAPVCGAIPPLGTSQGGCTVCIGSVPFHGTLMVEADGRWTYAPDEKCHGLDRFSLVVLEGRRIRGTVNVHIEVLLDSDTVADPSPAPQTVRIDIDVGPQAMPAREWRITAIDGRTVQPDDVVPVRRGNVVSGLDASVLFLPAPDFVGATSFACTVADGRHGHTEVQVHVETLDDVAGLGCGMPSAVGSASHEAACIRAGLLHVFERAGAGQPACFHAPMQVGEGLRVAEAAGAVAFMTSASLRTPDVPL